MIRKSEMASYSFSIFFLAMSLVPLLLLCLYDHPSTLDDFLVFTQIKNGHNFFADFRLGNRYTTVFWPMLIHFAPKVTIESIAKALAVYRVYAFFFIVFFSFSVYYLVNKINKHILNLSNSSFSLLFSVTMFYLINSAHYLSFFFYDIILTSGYTLGLSLLLVLIALLVGYYKEGKHKALMLTVSIIMSGTIEFYCVILILACFTFLIWKYYKVRKIDFYMVLLLGLNVVIMFSYLYAPWVSAKISTYAPGVADPHSLARFIGWIKGTLAYYGNSIGNAVHYNTLPVIVLIASLAYFGANRRLKMPLLLVVALLSIPALISFSLFYSGVENINDKYSAVMIMNVFVGMAFISLLIYIIAKCEMAYRRFVEKYQVSEPINTISVSISKEMGTVGKRLAILTMIVYAGCITIALPGLSTRTAWKDLLKGTAARYDRDVSAVYSQLLDSSDETAMLTEIRDQPATLIVDDLWTNRKFTDYPMDIDSQIGPFFGKSNIVILPR